MMIEAIVDAKYYWDNRYYEKVGSEVKDITDELPFEIPDNWVWIRLGYIVDFSQSDTVAASQINPSSWVLDLEDIEKDSGKLLQRKTFGETQSKSDKHCFFKGNVLYSKLRPYLNKVIVADADGYCTTEILAFNFGQHIAAQYAKTFFMSPYFVDYAMDGAYGVKMPRIGSHRGNSALMPLPPYTEQIHLVNRIDELFEQIDIIEQNQTDIDTLYDEFRKRTLTLAIQGKLVPQDPNDEPASVLLERIRAKKKAKLGKRYVDSYIYKGDDNCYYEHIAGRAQDEPVEVPFDIPDNWEWSKIKYIADTQTGTTPSTSDKGNFGDYISFVKPGDLVNGRILYNREMLSERGLNNGRLVPSNSVIMVCIGSSTGKCALTDRDISCNQQINTASPYKWVLPQYLYFFMMSDHFYKTVRANATGTATPIINRSIWENLMISIPPLAEQKRIVAKINEIFAML